MLAPDTPSATLSVSELNRTAKHLLEGHFDTVSVEGEIGDFTAAGSGHWYFSLKDSTAQVRCAMFRGANSRVRVRPARGDRVQMRAKVSLYENRGEFQLIVQSLKPAGDGALQLAYEQLKQRLAAEGLFDSARKRPLPTEVTRLGVVTSATGAALHDVLSVLARRSPGTRVYLFPSRVQGDGAASEIIAAIAQANQLHADGDLPLEALLVGRGGGSLEDLWCFNDEALARAIANSALPVVSAVGHEIDFTIADFAADVRAPTPSAAAELMSIDQLEWSQRFDGAAMRLSRAMTGRIDADRSRLGHIAARLKHPGRHLTQQRAEFGQLQRRLRQALQRAVRDERRTLHTLRDRLGQQQPGRLIPAMRNDLARSQLRLAQGASGRLQRYRDQVVAAQRLLESLNPANTLERGYAIVSDSSGRILRQASSADPGDTLAVKLAEGALSVSVTEVDSGQS